MDLRCKVMIGGVMHIADNADCYPISNLQYALAIITVAAVIAMIVYEALFDNKPKGW